MDIQTHKIFGANENGGRDYFVGDIHGRYTRLMKDLKQMRFDPKKDRLFCAGDLIDMGYENRDCIELLDQPWFFSSFGNHEQLFVRAMKHPGNPDYVRNHIENGGGWAWKEDPDGDFGVSRQDEALALVDKILEKCPFMMTVQTAYGRIGVIHADCPRVWPGAEDNILFDSRMLWNRSKPKEVINYQQYAEPHVVHGIDAVIHGHHSYHEILRNANRMWIDTADYGEFTIFRDEEIIACVHQQMKNHTANRAIISNPWMG